MESSVARDVPACSICNNPVELETSKVDENGEAVHEECYFLKLTEHAGRKVR